MNQIRISIFFFLITMEPMELHSQLVDKARGNVAIPLNIAGKVTSECEKMRAPSNKC